ncbi:porin [Paraburkholderia sp. Cy-641]|uniref:porin n=1 Tax=Paraburkholderia sp. Cy-641 TaxID=2608337 RepID=UPI00141E9524|nr:porin [Paraburkholderia sp. Cy-641]NIF77703.1 porin [Paraburkholderia sp. Cy-641]
MKKKLILASLVLGTGAGAACAQSSVTLYGILDAGIGYSNNQAVTVTPGAAGRPAMLVNHSKLGFVSGSTFADRWGLKGVEDLGGGYRAVFTLENGFNIGTGAFASAGTMFNRQAFVGLGNTRYGTLTFGRQYDPLVDLVEPLGPTRFLNGIAAHPGDLDDFDNSLRISNSVKYTSPVMGGFTIEALYGFGGQPGSMHDKSTYGIGAVYARGPLAGSVAYYRADNSKTGPDDVTNGTWVGSSDSIFNSSINAGFASAETLQIIGTAWNYVIGPVTLGLNYSNVQYRPGPFSLFHRNQKFNTGGAVASWQVTSTLALATAYAYSRGSSVDGSSSPPQYNQISVAAFKNLSKRTILFLVGGYQHASGRTLDAFGNVVDATASVGDASNGGGSSASNSQVVVRAGIRHHF